MNQQSRTLQNINTAELWLTPIKRRMFSRALISMCARALIAKCKVGPNFRPHLNEAPDGVASGDCFTAIRSPESRRPPADPRRRHGRRQRGVLNIFSEMALWKRGIFKRITQGNAY
ncbi:hypothetical protein EVAR_26772_1 [Eumeta japonica]|uniref:Uncharacterized protein n=1 Tax=Eumeta variegata TaxID=151549 RepID=A0A4C1XEL0_EUMVA|nr:hypothetical protein EVAR_26772_1 [Eumeta japonica]